MPYDGCFVDNTGGAMDASAGVFNVSLSGIYQLSFTAKYVSSNLVYVLYFFGHLVQDPYEKMIFLGHRSVTNKHAIKSHVLGQLERRLAAEKRLFCFCPAAQEYMN